MALIIRGKLPVGKGYDECEFQTSRCEQLDACTCFLFNGCIHDYHNERHKDCPIIGEIPDKHGRLIDADELEGLLDEVNGYGGASEITYKKMIEILHDETLSPTIVEATE